MGGRKPSETKRQKNPRDQQAPKPGPRRAQGEFVGEGERAIGSLLFVTLTPVAAGPVSAHTPGKDDDKKDHHETETPNKHVIVLSGENRTFDHLFATYVPQSKDSINNLLSEGIIKADGTPGKNFGKAG